MSYVGTTPKFDSAESDNIKIDGNTISSTDTNGDINLTPNGTGKVRVATQAPGNNSTAVATTEYVDDAVAAIPGVDLTGYATEQYVDDAIAAIPEGEVATAANVGTGSGVYKEKVGSEFKFKTIKSASNIVVTSNNDEVLIASNGVGGTDILFAQTFETAALTDFTQTGLSLSTSSPLHGGVSGLLTHQAGTSPTNDQSFKQVIAVDNKFRGQTMVLRLDVKSNASAGNVVIKIYDEANAANIVASEQLQLSNDVNGTKNSVGFTIPETCASLSYTITALPEAGSPVTRIDDIICELAETALLETAVEVPNVTSWQGYTPTFQGFGSPTNIEFEWRQVGENVEIRGKFNSGAPTAVEARIGLPAGLTSAGTSLIPSIQFAGKGIRGIGVTNNIKTHVVLIEPSVSYVTFGMDDKDEPNNPFTKLVGSSVILSGESYSFTTSVPCSGLSATTTKTIPLTQSGLVQEGDSRIYAAGNGGQAITVNVTDIPFTAISNQGNDISFNGSSVTALSDGVYSFDVGLLFTASLARRISVYVNGTNTYETASAIDTSLTSNITLKLNSGDVVKFRVSGNGGTLNNAPQFHYLNVIRQGSLKQVSVNPNSKITIPTSELRFEGASTRGSTATVIVKFDTLANLRGDAFTVESDSVLGTRITMKKAGLLNVNASCAVTTGSSYLMITKNLTSLTVTPSVPSEIISASQVYATTAVTNVTGNSYVNVGDIIRIAATGVPAGDTRNVLNLSFQEQDISVSVTNTLPQFSESDSSVRVTGGNGFTGQTRLFSNVIQNIGSDVQYTAASGQFRAMSSGIYNITYQEESAVSTNNPEIYIYVNEALITIASDRINTAASLTRYPLASIQLYLSEGDIVTGRVIATGSFPSVSSYSAMTISKVGKPNVTGVDVTPFINVPQPDYESIEAIGTFSTYGSTNTGVPVLTISKNTNKGIISVSSSATLGTSFTALKKCSVNFKFDANASTGAVTLFTTKNSTVLTATTPSGIISRIDAPITVDSSSTFILLDAGDILRIQRDSLASSSILNVSLVATALSDRILTAPETFSTDTASLTYAGSGTYTLSTLANAPVGTYITFTYAANGNSRLQTDGVTAGRTRPTQTDADMNTNGILLYTRAYNAASSGAQPAAIAIQIGKGLKGKTLDLYKSAGKVTAGGLDYYNVSTNESKGAQFKDYNENTGILFVDAGMTDGSLISQSRFNFSDGSAQTSGYLVINASKSPALTGVPLVQPRIATLSDVKASGTNGGTATSGSYQTRTLNTLSDPTGIVTSLASNQFTLPAGEYYIEAESSASFVNGHKAKLRNITDSADTLIGTVEFSSSAAVYASTPSRVKGNVVISSSKVFEIQHRVETTRATNGFGVATAAFGDNEVYAIVKITKVK